MDSTKWFWAYCMIKRGEKNYPVELLEANKQDYHYLLALTDALYPEKKTSGTGKFDRAWNYTKSVESEADWVRRNFIGRDPAFEAFLAGVLATVSAYTKEIERIKKGL